jgi:dihydrofolate synthase/folylpolyglutamate synthase
MPASVYSTLQRIGARAVVAQRDFSWQVHSPSAADKSRAFWPRSSPMSAESAAGDFQTMGKWSYRGLRVVLNNLPASALAGSIQYRNASASIAAIESLDGGFALNEQTVSEALRNVRLAGRFQVVPGPVEWILDIAHNEPAARIFAEQVRERPVPGGGRTFAVVGILADKDARQIAAALEPIVDRWILCSLPGARGSSASELATRLELPGDEATLANSVEEACEVARLAAVPGDRVIVFGSVYTVGPALRWLRVY